MKKRLFISLAVITGIFLLSASVVCAQSAPVAKTGQTASYITGDDGDLQKGIASPYPRFTDNGDGTVTDSLTGLMWAKDVNPGNGTMTWSDAIDYANNLSLGSEGCGASYADWRLPNRNELNSLIDLGNYNPALPGDHPFTNVDTIHYLWSSTAYANFPAYNYAWYLSIFSGRIHYADRTTSYNVWPVRGGN